MLEKTTMAGAFEKAGFPVAESRLRLLALDALRKHHDNTARALPTFQKSVGHDDALIAVALAHFLRDVGHHHSDAQSVPAGAPQPNGAAAGPPNFDTRNVNASTAPTSRGGDGLQENVDQRFVAVPVREPTEAQRSAAKQASMRVAANAFDRELTRTGQRWGNVYYRELDQMTMDADIAQAVRQHIGFLRGDQRHKQIRDLMTPREFAIVVNRVRKQHAA